MSPRWILYINKSYSTPGEVDKGSAECLALVGDLKDDVTVQDVDAIVTQHAIELPPWLDHTPTIVDTADQSASKGTAALRVCESIAQQQRRRGGGVPTEDEALASDRIQTRKVTDDDVQAMLRARQKQDEALGRSDSQLPP